MVHPWQMVLSQRIMSFVVWTLLQITLGWNIIRLPASTGAFTLSSHLQTWRLVLGTQDRFSQKLLSLSSSKCCHQGASQKISLWRISWSKLRRFMPISCSYNHAAPAAPTLLPGSLLSLVPNLPRDANSPTSFGRLCRRFTWKKQIFLMSKLINVHTFQMRLL